MIPAVVLCCVSPGQCIRVLFNYYPSDEQALNAPSAVISKAYSILCLNKRSNYNVECALVNDTRFPFLLVYSAFPCPF